MPYIVYEKNSTKRIDNLKGGPDKPSYLTMVAAKAARTRFLNAQSEFRAGDILIAEASEFYNKIEKEVEGRSAKDGTPVKVKVNTPYCCDPRFERYWAM
jgi:hypothetical protein